ncbi:MAG: hypothetical protein HYU48_02650, partial [Candidatus Levybacteria bacterium]|nr:hypothetical protein [Candidatus Levybacteria bacterium]
MSAERPERRTYFRIPNLALDFPLSELDGVNIENPLAKSLLRTATVKRLKGVSQLGLVITQKRHGRAHFHTRYQHIGTVTEIGERILRQNGFDEQEINLGVAAFILHDVGITAFGDSTKPLDPKNLEEEAHWREASNRRITTLLRRNNISPQQVDAIIHNGGVLGKVLDIADRIAYVSRDLSAWIDDLPRIEEAWGSQPRDGGNFLMTTEERKALLRVEPTAAEWIRPFTGADEFLNGIERWCLWLVGIPPEELNRLPEIKKRVEGVRKMRLASKAEATRKKAVTPAIFAQIAQPMTDYLLVPLVSSEKRPCIPIGFMPKEVVASNLCCVLPHATLYHFGVLSSAMHMAWVKQVCGRLKSDYRYSKDIVFNNYPWPEKPTAKQRAAVEAAAQ